MKKYLWKSLILSLTVLVAFGPTDAEAKGKKRFARQYGIAGCGLGSLVFEPNDTQVSAATTNGSGYNQLFGISSGTLNCVDGAIGEVAMEMDKFIQINNVVLASDIARGGGETVAAISGLMGCSNSEAVATTLQNRFSEIYPNEKVTYMNVTDKVITAIIQDKKLSSDCKNAALI